MSFHASLCGHIRLTPPLNAAEFEYLAAFSESRRHAGRAHPYDVPGHPYDDGAAVAPEIYNTCAAGQPSVWCPWEPSCGGTCLAADDSEKVGAPVEWLRYLVAHFLKPGALAQAAGRSEFADFRFDHAVSGAVAMCRSDDGELSLICGRGARVITKIVTPGDGVSSAS